jgi:hypothetical protein
LENKNLFLTGSLLGLDREASVAFLTELGGEVGNTLSASTDFWIVGTPELDQPSDASNALYRGAGEPIRSLPSDESPTHVISQRQLLAMIPGGLSAARALL